MSEIFLDVDTALSEVPVNILPLLDDTDFKTRETAVAYDAAGMDLVWNFVTSAGAFTQTAVTPTTGGNYDWTHQGDGMYTIEIPASGGASINNDTEGYGWFTGFVTGVLPWRGPIIGFRHSAINDSLLDTNTTGLLAPTTAGRTLDVSATGEAGLDLANISALPAGAIPALGVIDNGTAQSATGTTLVLRSAAAFANDEINGASILITGGSAGVGQVRIITDYVSSTDTATVDTWTTTPTGTITYVIFGTPPSSSSAPPAVNVTQLGGDTQSLTDLKDFADAGYDPSTNKVQGVVLTDTVTTYTGNTPQTGDSFARLGAPAGASVSADIAAIEAQTDDIGAAGAGLTALASAANLATVAGYLDTEIAAILALLDDPRGEPGQGNPPVNPDLATKIDYLYKAWRNRKTQTASEFALYADDGTTKDHEAAVSSDGTTLVIGEMATGA